jgi:hypothetical protein
MNAILPLPPSRPAAPFQAIVIGRVLSQVPASPSIRRDARAVTLLDSLADDVLTLSVGTEALRGSLDHVARDRSAQAAARTLRARCHEMDDVAKAVFDVLAACSQPAAAPLLAEDASLVEYLRGILAWWSGILRALEQVSLELRSLQADWATLRQRIQDATTFLLPEQGGAAHADVTRAAAARRGAGLGEVADNLVLLFATVDWLDRGLRERFG